MENKISGFNSVSVSQEQQYALPYHYIPQCEHSCFSQHLYWSWGMQYLGGIFLLLDLLDDIKFKSLFDIGCGDGRFLREVNNRYSNKRLMGVDYSMRAVNMAKALNPEIQYKCLNICEYDKSIGLYDVVTLVEVLEHIPVNELDEFVAYISKYLKSDGRLILTVPHKNKSLQVKHYQHFDSQSLYSLLDPVFKIEKAFYFDKASRIFEGLKKTLLGNRFFILNNQFLLNCIWKVYQKYFFICDEARCGRICVLAIKK